MMYSTKRFQEHTLDGQRFIQQWNSADRDGIQKTMAETFEISVSTIAKTRVRLGLEPLHSGKHPGRMKLIKRILKHYWNGRSSIGIGRMLNMNPENIRKILRDHNVTMNKSHCTEPLYFPFKNKTKTHTGYLKEIKRLYQTGISAAEIAKELKLDQGAVSKKLKAMDIKLKQNHRKIKGGYRCWWCGDIMETVWQNKGPRKQKFCGGQCKNKAKEFRRMRKGLRSSETRMKMMMDFLKERWGDKTEEAIRKLTQNKEAISSIKGGN